MIFMKNILAIFPSSNTKSLPLQREGPDIVLLVWERSKLLAGDGICEQHALELTRSPGEKDVKVDCISKGSLCEVLPMEPSQAAFWDLAMEVTLLVMEVVLT